MKAAIVTIGDEILIGQITDTNSGFIAKKIDSIGIAVSQMLSISDDKQQIYATLAQLQDTVDVVVITGGLGPTKDDITKKVFATYFEDDLVKNKEVLAHVNQLLTKLYQRPLSQINKDQALVPSKATVLFNDFGTAPGMWMEKKGTIFISLPGVPYEMKNLVEQKVVPKLVSKFKRPHVIHQTIMTYGVGESLLAEQIEEWEDSLPSSIKLAYLPSPGRVRLRLSARGDNKEELESALKQIISELTKLIGDIIVGFDDDEPIEFGLGELLKQRNETLSTAESCTGGLLASKIVSVSGASAYYKGSVVAYATEIKREFLAVSEELIQKETAVSTQVAGQMAKSIRKQYKTTYGIGITGNAGPVSSTILDDLGVVCIAISHPRGVFSERFEFGQPRDKVINRASNKAMEMLFKFILKN